MSYITLVPGAAPVTPTSGKGYVYSSSPGSALLTKNDAGLISAVERPRVNWLRNSGFWFAQRHNPLVTNTIPVNAAGAGFGPDGWTVLRNGADATYQRVDTSDAPEVGLRSRYYGQFRKSVAPGKMMISQIDNAVGLGGTVSNDGGTLRGRVVRLTFYLRAVSASVTWRMGMAIRDVNSATGQIWNADGTDPTNDIATYIAPTPGQVGDNCTIVGNGATITGLSTFSWTRVSCLFTIPTASPSSPNPFTLRVLLWSDSAIAVGNGINVAQCSLVDGYEIPDWPHDAAAVELARCQCYYAKTFGVDTKPAQNVGVNTGELTAIVGKAGAVANAYQLYWAAHFQMIITNATVTLFNPAAANALIRDIAAGVDSGAVSISALGGNYWFVIIATGNAGSAVGNQIGVHFTIDCDLVY